MRYNVNGLTANQQVFCDEYLKDRNATRAYRSAYQNVKNDDSAKAAASRLLTRVNVSAYIDRQEKAMHDESIADAQEVRRFLTQVMRGEVPDKTPVFLTPGTQSLVDVPPGTGNRIRAAELMGKLLGLFTDQVRVNVTQMPKIIAGEDGSVLIDDPGVE